jgi:hypothetical protein
MSATSATFRREALKSATETETAKLDLAAQPDPKATKPGPGFVGYDGGSFRSLLRLRRVGFVCLQRQSASGSARHVVLPRASAART